MTESPGSVDARQMRDLHIQWRHQPKAEAKEEAPSVLTP